MAYAQWQAQSQPLKLYQPGQERFYVVLASLLCRSPGLPDRYPRMETADTTFFVIRRLVRAPGARAVHGRHPASWDEQAWVPSKYANGGTWKSVGRQELLADEERLPLFPWRYGPPDQQGQVCMGVIPAANELRYRLGEAAPGGPGDAGNGAVRELQERVIDPLRWVMAAENEEDIVRQSVMILLALGEILRDDLPDLWAALTQPTERGRRRRGATANPFLRRWTPALTATLQAWPAILACSADAPIYNLQGEVTETEVDALQAELTQRLIAAAALVARPTPAIRRAELNGAFYVVRCVYERPELPGGVGPLISEASEPFQLAVPWDPDAPLMLLPAGIPKKRLKFKVAKPPAAAQKAGAAALAKLMKVATAPFRALAKS